MKMRTVEHMCLSLSPGTADLHPVYSLLFDTTELILKLELNKVLINFLPFAIIMSRLSHSTSIESHAKILSEWNY